MEQRLPRKPIAVGATLMAAFLWGTSFTVNDLGLEHVGPATFVFLRFVLAAIVMMGAAALMGRLSSAPPRHAWFWGLALANALGFLLQYVAQTATTPARTALFVNTSAFAVAILERVFYGVHIGPRRLGAIILGVLGAAILTTGGDLGSLQGGRLYGDLIAMAAGLAWSVYFVMNQRAVAQDSMLNVTAWTFALSALFLVPSLLLDQAPLQFGQPAVLPILYAGIATTALAYGFWSYGLRGITATASSVLLLAEILVASVVSWAVGREQFSTMDYVGAGLLLAAVLAMSLLADKGKADLA